MNKTKLTKQLDLEINDANRMSRPYWVGFQKGLERAREIVTEYEIFQQRVSNWVLKCFGIEIHNNIQERNHRFLEEALELVQSKGCTKEEALMLVGYVFNRPIGEPVQEVGGVMVTLAALCNASNIDMFGSGEIELERINHPQIIEKIRLKQATKPASSPLPQHVDNTPKTWVEMGMCVEKGCNQVATIDYNKHGHFVCKKHYDSLNDYFDEEYR